MDEQELELAKKLIEAKRAPSDAAKLKDKFHERVLELVGDRAPTAVPDSAPGEQRKAAPVLNIKEALQQSLDDARRRHNASRAGGRPGFLNAPLIELRSKPR